MILSDENGATYATQTVDVSAAFSLNASIGGVELPAKINSSETVMRSILSYQQASRAMSGGKTAFASATEDRFTNNLKSCRKRVELSLLAGGGGSTGGGLGSTASSANVDTTHTAITISTASWAAGIWAGLNNAQIAFYNAGSLVSSGADAIFTIQKVNSSGHIITVTGTTTGISTLDTAIAASTTAIRIYFYGAYGNQCTGLIEIAKNTGSLFNIDAGIYDLWKGNTVTLTGAPTMGKYLGGLADAVGRGLDEDGILLVSPLTWNDLNTNEAALRMYDSSWKQAEAQNGTRGIKYESQNGSVTVQSYLYMKAGESLFFVPDQCKRIGSVDVTYTQPGRGERIFFDIPDKAGYEFRSYSDQAVICKKPATLVYYSGFTNVTT